MTDNQHTIEGAEHCHTCKMFYFMSTGGGYCLEYNIRIGVSRYECAMFKGRTDDHYCSNCSRVAVYEVADPRTDSIWCYLCEHCVGAYDPPPQSLRALPLDQS